MNVLGFDPSGWAPRRSHTRPACLCGLPRARYTASVNRTRLIAAAVALAAACTMPGPAAAQTQPDERAAAREFAYAAYRLRMKIKASEPAIKQVAKDLDTPACETALGDDADNLPNEPSPASRRC